MNPAILPMNPAKLITDGRLRQLHKSENIALAAYESFWNQQLLGERIIHYRAGIVAQGGIYFLGIEWQLS